MDALPPPPLGGDVSRASVVIVPTIITVVIAVLLTLARLYVRISILNRLEWDDFFNVLATVRRSQMLQSGEPYHGVHEVLTYQFAAGGNCGDGPDSWSDLRWTGKTYILP